jgi:hypothetical protein
MHACRRDQTMSNPQLRTPFGQVELRPVAPGADGVQTYVLLPELDELLGAPGFGLRNPIRVGRKKMGLFGLISLSFH